MALDYQARIEGKRVAAFASMVDAIGFAKRQPCKVVIYQRDITRTDRAVYRRFMILESLNGKPVRFTRCRSQARLGNRSS